MSKKVGKKIVDEVAQWYSTYEGLNSFMIECLFEEFEPDVNGRVLEVGAADGFMTEMIVKKVGEKNVVVVEASEEYARKLKKAFPKVEVHNKFVEEFDDTRKFETIIASHVLEHVKEPVVFLESLKGLVKKRGKILLSVPNANSFHRLLGVEMGMLEKTTQLNEADKKIGHYRVYDGELLREHVEASGLRVMKMSGSFCKFLSNSQLEEQVDRELWRGFCGMGKKFPEQAADLFCICVRSK